MVLYDWKKFQFGESANYSINPEYKRNGGGTRFLICFMIHIDSELNEVGQASSGYWMQMS